MKFEFKFVSLRAQLRHSYNGGCERNDHSLFHYGFVQDLAAPKLAAQDLPDGNLYDESSHSEADYGVCLKIYINAHLFRDFCVFQGIMHLIWHRRAGAGVNTELKLLRGCRVLLESK